MALTVNSVTYRPFPETAGAQFSTPPFIAGAAGFAFQMVYDVTSTVPLTATTVYLNPAMWLPIATPIDLVTSIPVFGWVQNYPPLSSPTAMNALPTPRSMQGVNSVATITAITSTNFTIAFSAFYTFDLNDFANDTFAPSQNRFTYNNKNAVNELNNTDAPAVYNETRILRSLILIDDGTSIDYVFEDSDFQARWYEKGLLNASPGEFFDWTYRLERNNVSVTNFSPTEPTTVYFTVDTATVGKIRPFPDFLIYRQDSPIEGFGFFSDLEASLYFGSGNILGPLSITAQTNWALVSGTVYECSYTIDPDYLVLNGQYRVIIGAADDTGVAYNFHNSFISPLIIVTDAPPPPTTGTMTGEIRDYNDIYTGNCLQATLQERLQICNKVEKSTYNSELLINGAEGDFDTNLNNVQITITSFPDVNIIVNLNTTAGDPDLVINDTSAFYEVCYTFRIPESLANTFLQVNFIWNYDMIATDTGVTYKDIITYTMSINADRLEENKTTPLITGISFLIGGNSIIEICDDESQLIEVQVDVDASLNGYNLIGLIKPDIQTAIIQEQEDYNNNVLPQLNTILIDNVDVNFAAGTASFFIDPSQLDRGQKYRVYAVAKATAPPQPDCPVITLDAITEVTSTGPVGMDEVTVLDCFFFITNFSPSVVTNVDINTTVSGISVTGPNQNDNFVTDNGVYSYTVTFVNGYRGAPATVQQIFDITLSNGCTYTGRIVLHAISPILNNITQSVTQQNAD